MQDHENEPVCQQYVLLEFVSCRLMIFLKCSVSDVVDGETDMSGALGLV